MEKRKKTKYALSVPFKFPSQPPDGGSGAVMAGSAAVVKTKEASDVLGKPFS